MSEQPKKRPWFQFHLSTAVVLMFVAAGLLWLNMREYPFSQSGFMGGHGPTLVGHGWPCNVVEGYFLHNPGYVNMAINVAVAICIVLATAFILEWRIRRKERP